MVHTSSGMNIPSGHGHQLMSRRNKDSGCGDEASSSTVNKPSLPAAGQPWVEPAGYHCIPLFTQVSSLFHDSCPGCSRLNHGSHGLFSNS